MPKLVETPGFDKRISFPGDFQDTLRQFESIIKLDPFIQAQITPVQKASGLLSLGVRRAIEFYIKGDPIYGTTGHMPLLVEYMKSRSARRSGSHEQTEPAATTEAQEPSIDSFQSNLEERDEETELT